MPVHRLLPRAPALRSAGPFHLSGRARALSTTPIRPYPRKDDQDRNALNPQATEYSKSGSDDAAAGADSAAYDPSKTEPREEKDAASDNPSDNPLEVSPANPDVSQPRHEQEGGAEGSGRNGDAGVQGSVGGSPAKGKKVR